jgi:2,3-bisphosphoglycerate-dependent phosphoglycerate mutase
LRALIQHFEHMEESKLIGLNVPTGIPLVYELDAQLRPLTSRYLASEDEIAAATHAVAAQGKSKA